MSALRTATPTGVPPQVGWRDRIPGSVAALQWVGFAGAVVMAATSYWAGAVPTSFQVARVPVVDLARPGVPWARAGFYAGLAVLCLAWLALVRRVLDDHRDRRADVDVRALVRLAVLWAAPFALAVPLASRDAWAYVAQGAVFGQHLDPYQVGPGALGGSLAHLTDQVTRVWRGVPSPYGPLWVALSRAAVAVSGGHALLSTMVVRVPVLVGEALLIATAAPLARRFGGSPALAVCLAAANPVVLINGVGGSHNDVLMMGLVALALWIVTASRSWPALVVAAAVVGAAAAVKFPAAVAVPFLALLWPGRPPRPGPQLRRTAVSVAPAVLVALAAAGATFASISVATGLGVGWWRQAAGSSESPVALAGLAVALLVLWFRALRRPVVPALACAFLAMVLLGPTLMTWYWFWPLAVAATVIGSRAMVLVVAVGSLALVIQVQPDGGPAHLQLLACVALAALVAVPLLERSGSTTTTSGRGAARPGGD